MRVAVMVQDQDDATTPNPLPWPRFNGGSSESWREQPQHQINAAFRRRSGGGDSDLTREGPPCLSLLYVEGDSGGKEVDWSNDTTTTSKPPPFGDAPARVSEGGPKTCCHDTKPPFSAVTRRGRHPLSAVITVIVVLVVFSLT